jgi:RimJ/RimL family protein N-acetyltransferase
MRREAHLVENYWFKGTWADTLVYAILDREWHADGVRDAGPAA